MYRILVCQNLTLTTKKPYLILDVSEQVIKALRV